MARKKVRALAWYTLGIVLAYGIFFTICSRFTLKFDVPFSPEGDVFFVSMLIKTMTLGDWIPYFGVHSTHLGAPFGTHLGDYPLPEQGHFLLIRLLSLIYSDPIWLYNAYYVTTFGAVTVAFMFAMRQLRVSYPISLGLGLLYAYLPFHLIRYAHLLLASYFFLPLYGVILLQIGAKKPLFLKVRPGEQPRLDLTSRKSIFCIIGLLFAGGLGTYYAFFFALFAVISGIGAAWYRKSKPHLVSAAILAAVVTGGVALAGASNMVYRLSHGKNPQTVKRGHFETELYGLKLSSVLLPRANNRIRALARLRERYQSGTPIVEGYEESFCLLGSLGVLFLLGYLLFSRRRSPAFERLAILSNSAILYSSIGGFSLFFSYLISPLFRGQNRISIFIALFGFFALGLLSIPAQRHFRNQGKPQKFWILASILFALGFFDQVTGDYVDRQQGFIAGIESDRNFVQKIEKLGPSPGVILQLPYVPFPEHPSPHAMEEYAHARGILFSDNLSWSYGAIRGRPEAQRIEEASRSPLSAEKISQLGYTGIYVDRKGYKDGGKKIESEIHSVFGAEPMISEDARLAYFPIQSR